MAGNDDWLAEQIGAYQKKLFRYCLGMVGDEMVANDIVQDAFILLWEQVSFAGNPGPWLFRVCRNKCIDNLRKRGRYVMDQSLDSHVAAADADGSPGGTSSDFEAMLDLLEPKAREVVRLKFAGDLSYKEIADVTGLTASNVGFILHDSLKKIKNHLKKAGAL